MCGINDENTLQLLLSEKELTYAKYLEIAISQGAITQNVQMFRGMWSHVGLSTSEGLSMEPINAVKSAKQPVIGSP